MPLSYAQNLLRRLSGDGAAQLLEFAVALPLLLVFVVGIFDFGQAFNLKLKLTDAAREGARFGAGLPTSDLNSITGGGGPPPSVVSVRDLVDGYLQTESVNDCNLNSALGVGTIPTWTYSASDNGCSGTLTLTIQRAYVFQATVAGTGTPLDVICTKVNISYPYQWRFNRVIGLLVPGATYAGVVQISSESIVPNLD